MNRLQFAHFWLPYGWFWYPTDAFEAFAANAEFAVANMIGVATAALVIPCKTERLETIIDDILRVSSMFAVPFDGEVGRTTTFAFSVPHLLARSYLC